MHQYFHKLHQTQSNSDKKGVSDKISKIVFYHYIISPLVLMIQLKVLKVKSFLLFFSSH